jgi:Lrp/AsnC family transcriptional regulator, leucine-responsive regulatory protein
MRINAQLDELDLRILKIYQRDVLRPAHAIGSTIGLSSAAVQRRLKRLRELKVIEAEVAIIRPEAVGLGFAAIVHVDIQRETLVDIDSFKNTMRSLECVQQCWYTAGESDFVLVVRTRNTAEYETFTREQFLENSNVVKFTTHVVLSEAKLGYEILGSP